MYKNILANLILTILPTTRFFELKRILLNRLGLNISKGAKICGGTKIYGRGVITIGKDTWVGIGTIFIPAPNGPITIGSRCDIAPGVILHTGSHEFGDHSRRAGSGYSLPISIGDGTWIGTRAVILGGASIGKANMLGASTTILPGEYPDDCLIVGTPGLIKKYFNKTRKPTN